MTNSKKVTTFQDLIKKWNQHQNIVRLLILHHSKFDQKTIINNLNQKIDFDLKIFTSDIEDYLKGKPIQYIIGHTFFLENKIITNQDVFIPRPETEQLVAELIVLIKKHFVNKKNLIIGDICSGSGAATIALAKAFLSAKVYGLEISQKAIKVALKNNKFNHSKAIFKESNIDEFLIANNIKCDVIFCNPPYIKIGDNLLSEQVVENEPHIALFDKKGDGLSFHYHIIKNLEKITKEKAIVVFEIGAKQDQKLKTFLNQHNLNFFFIKDYNNIKRGLVILKNVKTN